MEITGRPRQVTNTQDALQNALESAIETAKILFSAGENTIETIAMATKLPIEEIKKLAEPKIQ